MFYSDNKKWVQILCNVSSNAIRFTAQGHVRVYARLEDDAHVRFAVQDSGIGIPVELHKYLFEDFVPLDPLLQKHLAGPCLGLPVCKQFEAPLSGLMRGNNAVGQVDVVLPAAAEDARGH